MAFAFGAVFVAVLLVFVFFVPNPTNQQFEVIRIVLALAAGGVAAMMPGFLNLRLRAGANLALRAGGALAVFVIVYFYSSAHWAEQQPPSSVVNQHTEGAGSPAINGSGNTVTTTPPTPLELATEARQNRFQLG